MVPHHQLDADRHRISYPVAVHFLIMIRLLQPVRVQPPIPHVILLNSPILVCMALDILQHHPLARVMTDPEITSHVLVAALDVLFQMMTHSHKVVVYVMLIILHAVLDIVISSVPGHLVISYAKMATGILTQPDVAKNIAMLIMYHRLCHRRCHRHQHRQFQLVPNAIVLPVNIHIRMVSILVTMQVVSTITAISRGHLYQMFSCALQLVHVRMHTPTLRRNHSNTFRIGLISILVLT